MNVMKFKNKKELVDFIKNQINVELVNDPTNRLNQKRKILYTEIDKYKETLIFSTLHQFGLKAEHHMKQSYWIRFN